jgi:hypothetical protein
LNSKVKTVFEQQGIELKLVMKLENNWRNNTLENLEKDKWPHNDFGSFLVRRTQELRRIPLNEFTIEDLRIMIGQQFSLDYLMPLAIEVLTEDLWAEGDFFEGDLLKNVLDVNPEFWRNNKGHWQSIYNLIKGKQDEIKELSFDASKFLKHAPAL